MRTLLFVPLLATRASAHGAMTSPPVWFDPLGLLAKTSPTPWVGGAMWFTNHTFIPGEPTIADDSALLTYPHNLQPSTPWRAPGTAAEPALELLAERRRSSGQMLLPADPSPR